MFSEPTIILVLGYIMAQDQDHVNLRQNKGFHDIRMAEEWGWNYPKRISALMVHRNKIPTANPIFSRSTNLMKLFYILCDASGNQKSKMASHTQEYLYLSLYTTLLRHFNGYPYSQSLGNKRDTASTIFSSDKLSCVNLSLTSPNNTLICMRYSSLTSIRSKMPTNFSL